MVERGPELPQLITKALAEREQAPHREELIKRSRALVGEIGSRVDSLFEKHTPKLDSSAERMEHNYFFGLGDIGESLTVDIPQDNQESIVFGIERDCDGYSLVPPSAYLETYQLSQTTGTKLVNGSRRSLEISDLEEIVELTNYIEEADDINFSYHSFKKHPY